ncbi:hypothetical protein Mapa_004903 [Marchantia paleacea]|nr:hypothetical protein Mapa_004903 [Marchantia paleacea]
MHRSQIVSASGQLQHLPKIDNKSTPLWWDINPPSSCYKMTTGTCLETTNIVLKEKTKEAAIAMCTDSKHTDALRPVTCRFWRIFCYLHHAVVSPSVPNPCICVLSGFLT